MDVAKILSELKEERVQIEEAILSLERLARGRGKRRGRPPAWMSEINAKRREPPSLPPKPSRLRKARLLRPWRRSSGVASYRRGYRVWGASPRRTFTFLEWPPR